MTPLDIIKRYSERLWVNKDISAIDDFFHSDATIISAVDGLATQGSDKMKTVAKQWLQAFPELKVEFEDFICEGNKVVSQWKGHGVHINTFMGYPATNKTICYNGATIYEIKAEKIVKYSAIINLLPLIKQLES